ncbi:hypothetical protein [Ferrovibrio sp.]|uniref:hypothetical protein n=1 Tax=Ferrovibrio sp. TaxID=1917215 RepID=UPI003D0F3483
MDMLGDIVGFFANGATGGLIGGLLRLVPEVLKLFQAKGDRAHELAMRKLDAEIAMSGGEQRIREKETEGWWAAEVERAKALAAAVAAQGKRTGIRWVDGFNAFTRPGITWYFALLFGAAKIAIFVVALNGGSGVANAVLLLWTPADTQAFFGILGFWFVGRTFEASATAGRR